MQCWDLTHFVYLETMWTLQSSKLNKSFFLSFFIYTNDLHKIVWKSCKVYCEYSHVWFSLPLSPSLPSPHVSAVSWETDRTLEGSVGGAVDILCKYLTDPESVFLTKMNLSKNVTIIDSRQRDKIFTRGRYSLFHDSKIKLITVTIHNLSREDAGIYRCGTAGYRDEDDFYTEIHLEVKHGELLLIRYIEGCYSISQTYTHD